MTKLSKAQVAILRRMGDGEGLFQYNKYGIYCWKSKRSTGPRFDSVRKLVVAGFIDYEYEGTWGGLLWTITPAGCAYLEGL